MKKFLLLLCLSLALQGCIFVVGAAAGAAGVAIVYDHRKIEKLMIDENIVKAANAQIKANEQLRFKSHIDVNCFNQIVLLTGEALSPELRTLAFNIVQTVPNIKKIYNQIAIKGPTSSLTQASDSWITTKIKTQMLATKGLQSSNIKVVTENGVVYLMGLVSLDQANISVNIARRVSGVQRVMKVFQYTD